MHKRLRRLAVLLAVIAVGATACGPSDASSAPSASTPTAVSTPTAPSASPSARGRGLKGAAAAFYLRTLRKHYPDLDHISDDALVAEGDALCTIRGAALGEQFTKSMRRLGTSKKQTSRIMGAAHGLCRDEDEQLYKD
ncbi:hypothetical protein DMA15_14835 [Streptomyces sp. WAC 01529]|uniref:hypothetical protein n=1 Tax=Streptomyces sp. WAC 01529 TaxID=2203205 RepID=UPI000F6FE825|nr:hypothetical protein [Streptomyces sp. WAC 01529]AZM53692.1 hypothetical protein DMA15_14835 [Streptomyces sp. WAC 01529]